MTDDPNRPTPDPEHGPDTHPDSTGEDDPWVKEGADAPDAADIEDPDRQL